MPGSVRLSQKVPAVMSFFPDSPVNFALPAKQTRAKNAKCFPLSDRGFPSPLGYGKCHLDFSAYSNLSTLCIYSGKPQHAKKWETFDFK